MDVQLQDLIDRIRNEGIDDARRQAGEIEKKAKEQADAVIADARRQADRIIADAHTGAEAVTRASNEAMAQAFRNLLLAFRDGIKAELDRIVLGETEAALDDGVLREVLPVLIRSWKDADTGNLAVLLPPAQLERLEAHFRKELREEFSHGLELKPFPGAKAGFRIVEKDSRAYYDFSAREIADLVSNYLNERLSRLVHDAAERG